MRVFFDRHRQRLALATATTLKVGDFETGRMAIHQLVSLFEFNLVTGIVTHLERTLQSSFAFGFNNVITKVSFVNKDTNLVG